MIENGGAILTAGVTELRVGRQRIDVAPEHIEQFFIADFRRIIDDLYRFRVARRSGADLFVSGILFSATGIAGDRGNHAFELIVGRLYTPETAPGKRCFGRWRVAEA